MFLDNTNIVIVYNVHDIERFNLRNILINNSNLVCNVVWFNCDYKNEYTNNSGN